MDKENNTSDKQENGNDFIADVSTRFFPEKQLRFNQAQGSRTLTLKGREINNKKEMIIMCEEYWEADDPNFGSPEQSEAGYFLYENEIDELIIGLKEAKRFLNGC